MSSHIVRKRQEQGWNWCSFGAELLATVLGTPWNSHCRSPFYQPTKTTATHSLLKRSRRCLLSSLPFSQQTRSDLMAFLDLCPHPSRTLSLQPREAAAPSPRAGYGKILPAEPEIQQQSLCVLWARDGDVATQHQKPTLGCDNYLCGMGMGRKESHLKLDLCKCKYNLLQNKTKLSNQGWRGAHDTKKERLQSVGGKAALWEGCIKYLHRKVSRLIWEITEDSKGYNIKETNKKQ